jgi:O-antigen/teichoic acid export membrane protein
MILNMPYNSVISGLGKFKQLAVIDMLNLAVFVGSMVVLTHPDLLDLKSDGAAITVLVSNIFIGILFRIYSRKHFPVLSQKMTFRFFLTGSVFTLAGFYLYSQYFEDPGYLIQAAVGLAIILVIYLVFLLMGWINRSDLKNVLSLLNFRAMKKYISKEIGSKSKKKD